MSTRDKWCENDGIRLHYLTGHSEEPSVSIPTIFTPGGLGSAARLATRELPDLPSYPAPIAPLDPTAFRLHVEGAVSTPLALSLDDLQQMPRMTVTRDFTCLEGWVVREKSWQGVPLIAVLERAGLQPTARYLAAYAADHEGGYSVLLEREQALAPGALLAFGKDGEPLSHAHGAPLRLQIPGANCYVQMKWVVRLVASTEPIEPSGPRIAQERLRSMRQHAR